MPVRPAEIYDRHAADFDADTRLEDLPGEFYDLLRSFVCDLPGPRVLDAGCGPGRDVAYFHGRGLDAIGVDAAVGMLEYARTHRSGRYLAMDVRNLAFEADRFDGIWCPSTIFFVPTGEMATVLDEFARVLRPDGVARIGFKLGEGPLESEKWGQTTMEYHVSEDRARGLLESAGFDVGSASVTEVSSGRTFANFRCRLADAEP